MPRKGKLPPGFCVTRLEGLADRSPTEKTELLTSIADDIQATLWCISRHLEVGNLTSKNTKPIEDMIRVVHGPETKKRRRLKRKMRQLQRSNDLVLQEQRELLDATDGVLSMYKNKVETYRQDMRRLREGLKTVEAERDLLWYRVTSHREGMDPSDKNPAKDDHDDCLESVEDQTSQLKKDENAEKGKDISTSV